MDLRRNHRTDFQQNLVPRGIKRLVPDQENWNKFLNDNLIAWMKLSWTTLYAKISCLCVHFVHAFELTKFTTNLPILLETLFYLQFCFEFMFTFSFIFRNGIVRNSQNVYNISHLYVSVLAKTVPCYHLHRNLSGDLIKFSVFGHRSEPDELIRCVFYSIRL